MKKTLGTLLFFTLTLISYSQERPSELQKRIDSLYAVWEDSAQPDSIRTSAYEDYIWDGFLFSRPDTVEILTQDLHAYAKKHNYIKASASGYNMQGTANNIMGNYHRAQEYYKKCLAIVEEIGDKNGTASSLANISNTYYYQGNYPQALEYQQKSLLMKEELGNKKGIANSLNVIGIIYLEQGNYPQALEYYQKSLAIMEELGDKKGIANALCNIGIVNSKLDNYSTGLEYFQKYLTIIEELGDKQGKSIALTSIGNTYYFQGNYPQALEYHQKSLLIKEELSDKEGIATCLMNIGLIYKDQDNYSIALKYYLKSLAIFEEIGSKKGIADNLNKIGFMYNNQGNYARGLTYCQRGLVVAEEIGALGLQRNACECLYNAYKETGDFKKALAFNEQLVVYKDSLFNEENTKKLTKLEMQYEFDKKEAATKAEQEKKDALAAEELNKQKLMRNGFMGGFAVVLLFAGVFLVQRNRIGKEKDRSENLLLNILPAEVARELKEKGESEAKDFEEVSVIFTDFQSFTQTAETLTAKELVSEVNTCFKAFDGITEKYGIEKIKTIGDAYMAAGGLHIPRKSEPKDVVKAALEMQAFMLKHKEDREKAGLTTFEMRVGVHTGPVVAGIVGVKKFQYDIWGDTVNTASRMESHGEVGKVNISEVTYKYLKDAPEFVFESRGKIKAKGKGEVEMYFVSLA